MIRLMLLELRADGVPPGGPTDGVRRLRPLPVLCPLPRRANDPKVAVAGWLAGRTARPTATTRTYATWAHVRDDASQYLRSHPSSALRLEELEPDQADLYAIGALRTAERTVPLAVRTTRRFPDSLDLGSVNDRRSRLRDEPSGPGIPGPPAFARCCFTPGQRMSDHLTVDLRDIGGDLFLVGRAQFSTTASAIPCSWLAAMEHLVAHARLLQAALAAQRRTVQSGSNSAHPARPRAGWALGLDIAPETAACLNPSGILADLNQLWGSLPQ